MTELLDGGSGVFSFSSTIIVLLLRADLPPAIAFKSGDFGVVGLAVTSSPPVSSAFFNDPAF